MVDWPFGAGAAGAGIPDTLRQMARFPAGAPPLMRRRAIGAQALKPGDPTYPPDFIAAYNAGINARANNATGAESDVPPGTSPFDIRMSLLEAQKRMYDQGLGNLPPAVAQSIMNNPAQSEGQAPGPMPDIAGQGSPAVQGEPYSPSPQIDDIQRLFSAQRQARNKPLDPKWSQQLQTLMKLPGFSGFTGGNDI